MGQLLTMIVHEGREGLLAVWLRPVDPDGDLTCGTWDSPVLYAVHRFHRALLPAMRSWKSEDECKHDPNIFDPTQPAGLASTPL